MSALASFDPRPVVRLYAAPRAWLAAVVCGMWGVGSAWIVVAASYSRASSGGAMRGDADLGRRLLTVALLALPATAGLLVGSTLQELRLRPVTSRLPGLASRLRHASAGIGVVVVAIVASVITVGLPGSTWLAALAVTALGYVLGLWALASGGGTAGWVARVGALLLAYALAEPLLTWVAVSAWRVLPALGLAVGVHDLRFRGAALAPPKATREHSLFVNRPVPIVTAEAPPRGPRSAAGAASLLQPPHAASPGPALWRALRRYERRTQAAGGLSGRAWLNALIVLLAALFVGPFIGALIKGDLPRSMADFALRVHRSATVMSSGINEGTVVFALLSALTILGARRPLAPGLWRPIPRTERARLAFHALWTLGVALIGGLVVFGAALVGVAHLLAPCPEVAGPPRYLVLGLAACATTSWLAASWLSPLAQRFRSGPQVEFGALMFVALMAGVLLESLWPSVAGDSWTALGALAFGGAAGLAVARRAFARFHATADLTADA